VVELTSRVQTQDRALDWSKKIATQEDPALLRTWTKATELLPPMGLSARRRSSHPGARPPTSRRLKAVYDWVLANTLSRAEGAGLRSRRHQDHARDAELRRQV